MSVLVVSSVISVFSAKSYTDDVRNLLIKSRDSFASGDIIKASELSLKARDKWNEYRTNILYSGTFEQHRDFISILSEIDTLIIMESDEYYTKSNMAITILDSYLDMQIPFLHNIF